MDCHHLCLIGYSHFRCTAILDVLQSFLKDRSMVVTASQRSIILYIQGWHVLADHGWEPTHDLVRATCIARARCR